MVLVVLGLIAGIGVANLGGGNLQRELLNEANRMHALLRLGAEEAIVSNNEIGVYLDKEQYSFVVYDEAEGQWTPTDVEFLKARPLPEWAQLDFQRVGKKRELPKPEKKDDRDPSTDDASRPPDLMLLSSGEVTEFVIGLEIQGQSDSRIEIMTDEQGNIVFGSDRATD